MPLSKCVKQLTIIKAMKCNLIVPGFAKCGSSSLHEYLDLHPQICMSSEKEPHYFALKKDPQRGPDWHDSLFDHASNQVRIFGESSTSYSVLEPALTRVKSELDNPKVILILREPLERLLSHYNWRYSLGLETLSLEEGLAAEAISPITELRRNGGHRWYRRASNYSHFVPLIRQIFGDNNVLLLKSVDLAESPQEVLARCFDFLGIDPFVINQEIRSNVTADKRVNRFPMLSQILSPLPSPIKATLKGIQSAIGLGGRQLVAPVPSGETLSSLRKELEADYEVYNQL